MRRLTCGSWEQQVKSRKKQLSKMRSTKSFVKKTALTSRDKNYLIHDNGGRPFKVVANKKGIKVYRQTGEDSDQEDSEEQYDFDEPILNIKKFVGYWAGFDSSPSEPELHGNSVLVKVNKYNYISVGWTIYSFVAPEEITDYVSPVGNSDVPYPVAYSDSYVYFMLDKQYINRNDLEIEATVANAEDLYAEFYGHINRHAVPPPKHRFKKVKIIANRAW